MNFIEELRWRGLVHDMIPGLEEELAKGNMMTAYIGYDPTAASLTVGNHVTIMMLKVFQKHGHKPIVVMGGATGRVGDPSGKSAERKLLDLETIERNLENQKKTFYKILEFGDKPNSAEVVDNFDIYKDMNVLEFLRDVGKYITVNYMMAKDSVKTRLETGLSFTEFSYQLLQGHDFVWLYKNKNCRLQMGGSDQWGNIITGTDLLGKMVPDGKAFALTCPLLAKADGTKFGKSEKGNIWLDGSMTTPYEYYQFWLNASDVDIVRFNRIYTLRPIEEAEALEAQHQANLGQRILQKALAEELTLLLHGEEGLALAHEVTNFIYNKKMSAAEMMNVAKNVWEIAFNAVDSAELPASELANGIPVRELLSEKTQFFASKSEVGRAIKENALSINKSKVTSDALTISLSDLYHGQFLLVEFGKKSQYILKVKG